MRLIIPCMQCLLEHGEPNGEFSRVGFLDNSRYEVKCSFGHETTTFLQQQKFEVLFEIGAHAILDGYYREAVSSFASSVERFFEFALQVILEKSSNSDALFQSTWKTVAAQSERQLGAFVFAWASNFGKTPELVPSKWVSFRNEVVHKGKIPTREEALQYGNVILGILRPKMLALKDKFAYEVSKVALYRLRDCRIDSDDGRNVATMCILTLLSLTCEDAVHHTMSIEEHLLELSVRRRLTDNKVPL